MPARVVRSFRISSRLWKAFKEDVIEKGLSTCLVLEELIKLWKSFPSCITNYELVRGARARRLLNQEWKYFPALQRLVKLTNGKTPNGI